jgi:hypothetical protein
VYINAYRKGRFRPKLVDILLTGTFWPKIFLENPDTETTACSVGRPIRLWIYSLLEDALGLPESFTEEEETETDDSNDDELIDVVEEDSDEDDLLAPLRGALQKLHSEDETDTSEAENASTVDGSLPSPSSTREVTEYIRRGSHISEERVPVPPLSVLLSQYGIPPDFYSPLASSENRMTVFFRALEADIPEIRALRSEHIIATVAIRWVVRISGFQTGSWTKERWTRQEVVAFLATLLDPFDTTEPMTSSPSLDPPIVSDRNLHLMGQVLTALATIELLVDTLLLTEVLPNPVIGFSGLKCHRLLNQVNASSSTIVTTLTEACCSGIEDLLREDNMSTSKTKKKKKKNAGDKVQPDSLPTRPTPSPGSLFDLLGDVEA